MGDVQAVLFDFGNTLFAHEPLADTIGRAAVRLGAEHSQEWSRALADRIQRAAHTEEELTHPRDLDATVWYERWQVLYGAADDELPGLGAEVYALMHDPFEWRPYATTVSTLRRLHVLGVPIGVVSNTGWDVRTVFAAYDVHHLVQAFLLSYEVGAVKPVAQVFLAACDALGASPGDTLMVGDDPVADAGAVHAGVRTLLLPSLHPGAANGVEGAARIVAGD